MKTYNLYQVNITYKCNMDCNYCYARSLKEDYGSDMSLEDFKKLLDWFGKNNIKNFNMLGGEPTIHPMVKSMLKLADEKKFKITLFTNGLFPDSFLECADMVQSFLINYNHKSLFTKEEYELLHKNLAYLKNKNKPITLAFNITDDITSCDYVIEAAKKYNAEWVNIDLIIPNSLKTNKHIPITSFESNKKKISKFLEAFKTNGIRVRITRPLPLCVFKDEKDKYKKVLSSTCTVGQGIISINPDLTVFPCLSIFFKGPKIISFNNFQEAVSFYKEVITDLKWKRHLYPECESCVYHLRKKCQGSCLSHKCTQFEILNKQDYTILSQHPSTKLKEFIIKIDKAVTTLNQIFGKPKQRFKIYLFNNKKDLLYYSGVYFYPDWVSGFISKNVYYQYSTEPDRRIIHELCHIYIGQYKKNEPPLWLEEGFCEWLVYKDHCNLKLEGVRGKKLMPFDMLFDRDKMSLLKHDSSPLNKNIAYIQSSSFVNHLIKRFGLNLVMKLLKNDSENFKTYFKELTSQEFEDVEKEWLDSIKNYFS